MRARASSTATQANGTREERDLAAEAAMEGGDQGSEERVVEAEIEAEEDEDTGGDGLCETAVEVHGLVDPVAVAQVPEEAADDSREAFPERR